MIRELTETPSLRSAEGQVRIANYPNDPLQGASIEVFGPDQSVHRHVAESDRKGHFKLRGLVPGHYLFHVGKPGFNSVVGQFVIHRKSRSSPLLIEMTLGV